MTQFNCGGFALGLHLNHCIADGFGWIQLFLKAVADLARGEPAPLVLPVWRRQLLTARSPPSVASAYPAFRPLVEGTGVDDVLQSTPLEGMARRCFLFGRREVAVLRSRIPADLGQRCTDFDVLTAVTWYCRTAALGCEPSQKTYLYFPSRAHSGSRRRSGLLHVPKGYYGNALMYTIVEVAAGELLTGGLPRAAEMVCEGRNRLTPEYARSTVDLLASLRGRRLLFDGVYVVSDITRFVGDVLDFGCRVGWTAGGIVGPKLASFHMKCKNTDGEESVAVSMLLPDVMMERFEEELAAWLNLNSQDKSRRRMPRPAL